MSIWIELCRVRDEVDGLGVIPVEQGVEEPFSRLRPIFDNDRGAMVVSARVPPAAGESMDLLDNWRPVWYHRADSPLKSVMVRQLFRLLRWTKKEAEIFQDAGQHRARVQSTADHEGHPSHRALAQVLGVAHRLGVVCNIDPNVEAWFLIDRSELGRPYEPGRVEEGMALAHVLQPLARRWTTQLGVLRGKALSRRERDVLREILKGNPEKIGAANLGLKKTSYHQVVVSVYRKLGVSSRPELTSLFLDGRPEARPWTNGTIPFGDIDSMGKSP